MVYNVLRDIIIPVADLSFLCKYLMCGIQESLLSIVTPKNLVDDTTGIGVSFLHPVGVHYL